MTTEAKQLRGELMSTGEVARKIKRSPSLIPALVQAGRLPVFHKGEGRTSAYLFDSADVDDYLADRDGVT